MKIKLITVGRKHPAWVQQAVRQYCDRLPPHLQPNLIDIPLAKRSKNTDSDKCREQEAKAISVQIKPPDHVLAFDVGGKRLSTWDLSTKLNDWQLKGQNIALIIGGPDGLSPQLLQRSSQILSLSDMTFPHPLAKVIVCEQLYRAWTINSGHPYHR